MTTLRQKPKIGILGHVGNGNLGDEALVSAVIQNIYERFLSSTICAFTLCPKDTRQRHNIAAYPLRRNSGTAIPAVDDDSASRETRHAGPALRFSAWVKRTIKRFPRVHRVLKKSQSCIPMIGAVLFEPEFLLQSWLNMSGVDLLMISGSSQLIDYVFGGPWGHPYTLFKWVLIAKLRGAKVAFMSCGAGPVNSPLSRFLLRNAISMADFRSCRDAVSVECVKGFGLSGPVPIYPDLAYDLRLGTMDCPNCATPVRPNVGINAIPFSDPLHWVGGGPDAYRSYVERLAGVAS